MEINSDGSSKFAASTLKGIARAAEETNFLLDDRIDFELSITTERDKGGKIRIHVVDVGVGHSNISISKIRFSVTKNRGL